MNYERELIGACFTYEKCLIESIDKLDKKHFQYFGPIFECIQEFYKKGRDHEDIIFDVSEILRQKGHKKDLYEFVNDAVPSVNEHIDVIIDRWKRKNVKEISDMLYKDSDEEPEIDDLVMRSIHSLSDLISGDNKRQQTMKEVMDDTLDLIERIKNGEQLGFTTNLDLDKITKGMQKGQFYILAARPSMGKTALAVQIAQQVSLQSPVGFLSLETTNQSLGLRFLANHSRIDGEKVRGGYLNDSDMNNINSSAETLSDFKIVLDDTTDISAEGIRAKINGMTRKHGIEFLIIDYVQLMKSNRDNREQQVAEISRACVSIAKEFDICVLGLAQLNRGVENRGGDKRPMLSDLRESGQLEQDAFCVMLLHRPEYYGIKTYPNGESTEGIAEIIIAKHKDGKTGIKKLLFQKETMRFENLTPY